MAARPLIRSPLVHFFVLGACIFAGYRLVNPNPAPPRAHAVSLSRGDAASLVAQFTEARKRPPSTEELEGLMRSWAQDEIFVREALSLGLDRDDPVIRQRLIAKMQYIAESGASSLVPDDEVLARFLTEHRDQFEQPLRIAFNQILLAPESATDVVAIRVAVEAGVDPENFSKPSLLPPSVVATAAPAIDGMFGPGFAEAIETLPQGRWAGPVESRYGRHLVRVIERRPSVLPSLHEIRERVEREWRTDQARQMRKAYGEELLRRYSINLPAAEDILGR